MLLDKRESLWVGIFALCIFLIFHSGHFYHVDEELHFLVADSILNGNWGAISPTEAVYYRGEFRGVNNFLAMGKFGPGGRFYAKSGIGQPLLVVPLLAVARFFTHRPALERFIVSLFCPFLGAITVMLLFHLIVSLGFPSIPAFVTVCSLAFGTFFFAQAKFFMNHMLAAMLLVLGILCVREVLQHRSVWLLFASGLSAGWIVLARIDCFTYALLIPLYWVLNGQPEGSRRLRSALLLGAGLALSLSMLAVWNVTRSGHIFDLGYNLRDPSQPSYDAFDAPFLAGFFGQLFNLETGLIWYAPPLLVSVLGFRALNRVHFPLTIVTALGLLLPLSFYAKFSNWRGEISWGPRFLLPALPLLAVACAPVWEQYFAKGRHKKILLTTLLLGLAVQLCGVLADHNRGFVMTSERIARQPLYGKLPF
ncbi:MAG TPA: hypothetical protein VGQ81_13450, partial [Acidobacteriota bacterium]|nr:hypothetical protein [Acidobacteriota bacterium]